MTELLTPELEAQRMMMQIGECMNAWSVLEAYMEKFLQRITRMDSFMSQKMFFSLTGFDARYRILYAAVETSKQSPNVKVLMKTLLAKAKTYSKDRNHIVHGLVITFPPGYKYHGQSIIVQGKDTPSMDPPRAEILTIEDLKIVKKNFNQLISIFDSLYDWKGDNPELFPQECLLRAKKLPKTARRTE